MNLFSIIMRGGMVTTALFLLSNCSGGGGGTFAGIDRLGVNNGTVVGFGSVKVGGVEYETNTASFEVDGNMAAQQSDLDVGDVVLITVDPAVSSTRALRVLSSKAVTGPVEAVDTLAGELVIAGQTVLVDGATLIDDSAGGGFLSGVAINDVIAVSGFAEGSGRIHATRLEAATGLVEIHGQVSNLNVTAMTFSIGGLTVDYGAVPAVVDSDFDGGMFVDGDEVEVKGNNLIGSVLQADLVNRDDLEGNGIRLGDFDDVEGEIEGLVTRFASATDFDVDGIPVTTNGATQFENGVAADIVMGIRLEVDGPIDQSGLLIAEKIEFRRDDELRVSALVDSVDAAGSTVVALGLTIGIDSLTRIEDQSDANVEPLSLSQINVNDYIEVRGSASAVPGLDLIAGILEREDLPAVLGEDTELRGRLTQLQQPTLMVGAVSIVTDNNTQYHDKNGSTINQMQFFATAVVGDLVDADGVEVAGQTIAAREVSLIAD